VDTFLLAATLVVTVLIGAGGLYLQYVNNKHFAAQNEIMLAQGPKVEEGTTATRKPPKWPLLAMGAMLLFIWAAVGFDYADRHKEWSDRLEKVEGKHYVRETVPLDGIEYINSTFEDVTFKYEGSGPTRMTNVQFTTHEVPGAVVNLLTTNNRIVAMTETILANLNQVAGCTTITYPAHSSMPTPK
jgi:hypothetical protein